MCAAFRRLCARADVITPNMTEAAFLTGRAYHPGTVTESEVESLLNALCALGTGVAAITGVLLENGEIGNAVRDAKSGKICFSTRKMHGGVFYGTGDIFASALSALLVRGAPIESALELATALVEDRASVMFIPDGHHLPDTMLKLYCRAVPLRRLVAVSDSQYPAGMPPGDYDFCGVHARLEPSGLLWNPERKCLVGATTPMSKMMDMLQQRIGYSYAECRTIGHDNPLALIGM